MATPRALWRATISPFPSADHRVTLASCRFYGSLWAGHQRGRTNPKYRTGGAAGQRGNRPGNHRPRDSDSRDWANPQPSSVSNFNSFMPSDPPRPSTGFEPPSPPHAFDILKSPRASTPSRAPRRSGGVDPSPAPRPASQPAAAATTPPAAKPSPAPAPAPPKPQPAGVISYLPPPSNDPQGRPARGPAPADSDIKFATTTFTSKPPKLVFSSDNFAKVPIQEHTPEVCVIGRSNVGKSTLINALGGIGPANARHAHGAQARSKGLAITSRTAGSTKTMNAYGYGTPSKAQMEWARNAERQAARQRDAADTRSRTRRRNLPVFTPPTHRLTIVDMPGYGQGSRSEWGTNIEKYLEKRKVLKGAIFLVDAEVGLKDTDLAALAVLKRLQVRTAVVLTKAEKVMTRDEKHGGSDLDAVCMKVWEDLRTIEQGSNTWLEGAEKGWEKELWVTSAGDAGEGGEATGVLGARWAICRMAGLGANSDALPVGEPAKRGPPPAIRTFEDIERHVAADKKKAQRTRLRATF